MGQKVNPNGFRFGVIRDWKGKWFAKDNKQIAKWTIEDRKIRNHLEKYEKPWLTGEIIIERFKENEINIQILSAKPGAVLGQDGANLRKIEKELKILLKNRKIVLNIDVRELPNPDLSAKVIANEIALSLENRGSFRSAQKKAMKRVMKAGGKGVKTLVSGRLNGVDMARSEGYSEGVIPLQTIRNDIDFAIAKAHTTYGVLGVKVWISRGEILLSKQDQEQAKIKQATQDEAGLNKKPFRKRFDRKSREEGKANESTSKNEVNK